MKKLGMKTVVCVLAITATGCGQPFQSSHQSSHPATLGCIEANCTGQNSSNGDHTPPPTSPSESEEWKSLEVEGAVNGGFFDKTQVVGLDKQAKELILRLPMTSNPILDGASLEIPVERIPGARLTLEPLPQGGSALVLRIPLAYVLRGVDFLPPSRLPNGDALPSIPDGELPATAVQLSSTGKVRATIYLAPTVVGIFVNTPFDPYIRLTLPVRNKARTRTFGYFTTIPEKKNIAEGGFFISAALPDDLVRIIDDNL